jgi:hypothetical protein
VELHHLRDATDSGGELRQPILRVLRRPKRHKHGDADAELLGIEEGDTAADEPFLLKPLDSPPAGVLGKIDRLRHLRDGAGGVLLQKGEDADVLAIEADGWADGKFSR